MFNNIDYEKRLKTKTAEVEADTSNWREDLPTRWGYFCAAKAMRNADRAVLKTEIEAHVRDKPRFRDYTAAHLTSLADQLKTAANIIVGKEPIKNPAHCEATIRIFNEDPK